MDLKSKLDELQKKLDLSGEKVAALEKEKGQLIKVTLSKCVALNFYVLLHLYW